VKHVVLSPPKRDAVVKLAVSRTPGASAGILKRAYAGTAAPRSAIKAKCLECTTYQRSEITGCTVFVCPLWAYRPFQETEG
jgi:hypothetical protein